MSYPSLFFLHLLALHGYGTTTLNKVYEDDIERNYYLIREILLGCSEILPGGIPAMKDMQVTLVQRDLNGFATRLKNREPV